MMNKKKVLLSTALASLVLVSGGLVACGSKDDDSNEPAPPSLTALEAPANIRVDGTQVKWDANPLAAGYDVTVNAEAAHNTINTYYELSSYTTPGDYVVRVVAVPTDTTKYKNSPAAQVTYTVQSQGGGEEQPPLSERDDLVRIEQVAPLTKTTYYLDEKAEQVDLSGAAFRAVYDEEENNRPITLTANNIVGNVDLSVVGPKTVEIAYSEGGKSRSLFLNLIVKERTIADLEAAGTAYTATENAYAQDAERYLVSNSELTSAVDMKGNAVTLTVADGKTYIAGSTFTSSGSLLIKANNGAFINVIAAKYISTKADFLAINDDLAGYYILQNDISFGGLEMGEGDTMENIWSQGIRYNAIGKAPLSDQKGPEDHDADYLVDFSDSSDVLVQGRAFTGTLDGKGYKLDKILLFYPEAPEGTPEDEKAQYQGWHYNAHYMGIFGYIGETGVVKNFSVTNSRFSFGKRSSIIAGVNMGTISNVVVEDTCSMSVAYSTAEGFIADYNGGRISNCACYVKTFTGFSYQGNNVYRFTTAATGYTEGESESNIFVCDTSDKTEALGAGWHYIQDHGTVYGNDSYTKLISCDRTWYVGQDATMKVYTTATAPGDIPVSYWGIPGFNAENPAFTLESESTSGLMTITVKWAEGINSTVLPGGSSFVLAVGKEVVRVHIGQPYVTELTAVVTQNIRCTTGDDLVLSNIDLTATLSDGTSTTVHPTNVEGFDKDTAGTQNVTFVYQTESVAKLTIDGTVEVADATGEITATLKSGVTRVIIPFDATAEVLDWAASNVTDWTEFFDISTTGYSVSASALSGSGVTFTISKEGYSSATVTVDCYLAVDSAAAFAAINKHLDGYYLVTQDINFNNNAATVGSFPLGVSGEDTVFDSANPTLRENIPFTGIFDGNGKTLSKFKACGEYVKDWSLANVAMVPFQNIGATGKVMNFTLKDSNVKGCTYMSFIAGLNTGEISGITIDDDCTVWTNWPGNCAIFAAYNYGTIKDCNCYAEYRLYGEANTQVQLREHKEGEDTVYPPISINGAGTVQNVNVIAKPTGSSEAVNSSSL